VSTAPNAESALTHAAQALHKLRLARQPRPVVVRLRGNAGLLAVIDAADQRVHTLHPLERLVDDLAKGTAELATPQTTRKEEPKPGARFSDESFLGLCWLVGARLGQDVGLAPWLSSTTVYHLRRRPDAADIGNDADQARLVELMAKREFGISSLIDTAQLPHRTVYRLVNSLSLCGLLGSGAAPRQETPAKRSRTAGPPPPAKARPPRWACPAAWLRWLGRLWESWRAG
jgi:hypothetical protein